MRACDEMCGKESRCPLTLNPEFEPIPQLRPSRTSRGPGAVTTTWFRTGRILSESSGTSPPVKALAATTTLSQQTSPAVVLTVKRRPPPPPPPPPGLPAGRCRSMASTSVPVRQCTPQLIAWSTAPTTSPAART